MAAMVLILIHRGLVQHQQVLVLITQAAVAVLVLVPRSLVLAAQAAVAQDQMGMETPQHREQPTQAAVVAAVELTATAEVVDRAWLL